MKKVFLAIAALVSSAGASYALDSNVSRTSSLTPAAVRTKIGDFCGVANFVPVIAKCELSGDKKLRTITLKGGGTVVEAEEGNDATGYGYTIVSSPLPVDNYHAKITIVDDPAGSKVIWTGKYDAKGVSDAEAKKVIDDIYEGGLKSLLGG